MTTEQIVPVKEATARTVTATAFAEPAQCAKCGSHDSKNLWGVNVFGITTALLAEVHHWICRDCF